MNTPKRIFIGLLLISLLTVSALLFIVWLVATQQINLLSQIFLILETVIFLFLGIIAFGIFSLVVTLLRSEANPSLQNLMLAAVNLLFPIALSLGKFFKIDEDKIKGSFVAVNNELVLNQNLTLKPHEILILAPHCLQWSKCQYKITVDPANCRRCGRCVIHKLHNVKDKYGVKFVVASGGTLARKFVKEIRPKAIVAIACERDLTSGIQEINPMPVLGVLNLRPEGPCFNTDVHVDRVEEAIQTLLGSYAAAEDSVSRGIPARGLQRKIFHLK